MNRSWQLATWEEEEDIPCGEEDFVAQYEAAQEGGQRGLGGRLMRPIVSQMSSEASAPPAIQLS